MEDTPPRREGTRLSGRLLVFVRIVWVSVVTFFLVLFVIGLPVYVSLLHTMGDESVPLRLSADSIGVLQHMGISFDLYVLCALILNVAIILVWILVGGVLFWRRSDDWLVLLGALAIIWWGTGNSIRFAPQNPAWHILFQCLNALAFSALILFCTLFPNGRFIPGWMRWITIVLIALWAEAGYLFPDTPFNPNSWPFPLGSLGLFAFLGSIVGTQMYRYRFVSNGSERQQTKWIVYALSIAVLAYLANSLRLDVLSHLFPEVQLPILLSQLVYILAGNVVPVVVPLAIGIAILRYRLWDIDIIINRTLVYGVLTVSIIAFYVLVVVGLGTLFQAQGNFGIALLATGLVAVLFAPARTRLQRLVNRLMYGDRDDPYRVISRLGHHLEATLTPDAVLPTIVETVAQALKLPYAAISLQQGDILAMAASYGSLKDEPVRLPLVYQNEPVGEFVLAPRAPGESFTPADRTLLEDLARQVGIAAHAVRLTAALKQLTVDLQHARERLVTAREEERRRLRRDLHDGLGPQLATLTLKLETARNRLAHEPLADPLFADLTARTQAAITDIRRLVYALRPPALDELGLPAALREQTLQYSDQIHIRLDVPECLPPLSAAVEAAIYRIAQEALTNVVRHAQASWCDVRLVLDEQANVLRLEIQDNGCGLPAQRKVGVGLVSMRERAEELGGTWLIEPVSNGGTRVLMQLPYRSSETTGAASTGTPAQQEEE